MADNYKHLYEQAKKMLVMYQDELIPGFRKHIEELEAKSKWIPVSERLPEENDKNVLVIVSAKYENIRLEKAFLLAQYDAGDGWILEMFPEIEQPDVTHWMLLPEPPKEE